MEITAKVICDTLPPGPETERLTTFVCTVPKFLLQELNTHRTLCKNAASSRAIPVMKMKEKATYTPRFWPQNVKGMQAGPSVDEDTARVARGLWDSARKNALDTAEQLAALGIHKEVTNRILEPFLMVPWIVTGTKTWLNYFFNLRCVSGADNAMGYLAYLMAKEYLNSVPSPGLHHRPFFTEEDALLSENEQILVLAARAARISYANFEGKRDTQDDLRLGNDLWSSGHLSPFDHYAFFGGESEPPGPYGYRWHSGRDRLVLLSTTPQIKPVPLGQLLVEFEPVLRERGYLT